MDENEQGLSLGKTVEYIDQYSPELLYSIGRQEARDSLGIAVDCLPFTGVDIWNAYELSWLNAKGKPEVACAEFRFPCESEAIIESKSFKLYLNSLNQTHFNSIGQLQAILAGDLSHKVGALVDVSITDLEHQGGAIKTLSGQSLDQQDIEINSYQPEPSLLTADPAKRVDECLYSHLLRSLCPVTGQPDWGSVVIEYRGPQISHEGLLKYLIGYRSHQAFHEQCVEQIFMDIMARCGPSRLSVYARYVRRGGLDINPYRSTEPYTAGNLRLQRQ